MISADRNDIIASTRYTTNAPLKTPYSTPPSSFTCFINGIFANTSAIFLKKNSANLATKKMPINAAPFITVSVTFTETSLAIAS